MRDVKNIEAHELIGLQCTVVESTNELQVGISGMVVDETKNTLRIMESGKIKTVQKNGAKFRFDINGRMKIVSGDRINYRPHERTKKVVWRRRIW